MNEININTGNGYELYCSYASLKGTVSCLDRITCQLEPRELNSSKLELSALKQELQAVEDVFNKLRDEEPRIEFKALFCTFKTIFSIEDSFGRFVQNCNFKKHPGIELATDLVNAFHLVASQLLDIKAALEDMLENPPQMEAA